MGEQELVTKMTLLKKIGWFPYSFQYSRTFPLFDEKSLLFNASFFTYKHCTGLKQPLKQVLIIEENSTRTSVSLFWFNCKLKPVNSFKGQRRYFGNFYL